MSALTIDEVRAKLVDERDALHRQLRWIDDSLTAIDDIVKGVLDGAPAIKGERGPAADVVILDDPPATTAEPKPKGSWKRRRFTDEEKHLAVREAESGVSDASVERRLGLAAGSITRWRKAGFGRKPAAMGGTATGANPGRLNPDDYRHEIALSRKLCVAELEHGGDWIEIETFAGALDMAEELLAEVERLRALAAES